jgi:hypothetical protein
MTDQTARTHHYHGEAFALIGNLSHPVAQEVKPIAFSKLAEEGGYLSQRLEKYRLEAVVSFQSAYTHVAGNLEKKPGHGWNTLTTAVIEGFNVLDVVTADRIVAQIGTEHPLQGYVPTVTFLGTRFENLRISGYPVNITFDHEMLGPKPANDLPYSSASHVIDRVTAQHRRISSQSDIPTEVSSRYNQLPSSSTQQRVVECSLVNQVEGGYPGRSFGHVIDVPHFGQIYLATLRIEESDYDAEKQTFKKTLITLNMIELRMGCIGGGTLSGGGNKTNGGTYP